MNQDLQVRIETANAVLVLGADAAGCLVQTHFGAKDAEPGKSVWAYPPAGSGWFIEPALQVIHSDGNTSTELKVTGVQTEGNLTRISLADPQYPLQVELCYRAVPDLDVIESWTVVRHSEPAAATLVSVASSSPCFGADDYWLTQFYGNWADEANLYEEKLGPGMKVLDSKLGVRAHQFRSPWFVLSRGAAAQEDSGEVFGGSLFWSGSFRFAFEKDVVTGLRAICGINPYGSAYVLEPNATFETPKMAWAYSAHGTGDLSRKLHRYVRREVVRDGHRPRTILLNNWEATFFHFDETKIVSLFDGARDLGMELFLLDDGWFGSKYPRDDDTQGLGDWMVDAKKLPNGIGALTSAAAQKGLRFGLWFEPEMVNPRSELLEKHPDWAIQQPKREHDLQRTQLVLDLSNPEVTEYVFSILDDALTANPGITYIKWDCNRYLTQPGSPYLPATKQQNLQIDYVNAVYDVMARVAKKHPEVEIMICSGGGGRADYGAIQYAHELWPSDMTDPLKRIFIQWGYSFFMPAICAAAHVTHWGGRPLKFATDVAMSDRFGMDLDVDTLNDSEKVYLRSAVADYMSIRDIVQLGDLYRLESPYNGARSSLMMVLGDVAALFVYASDDSPAEPVRLKGLCQDASYVVKELSLEPGVEGVKASASGADLLTTGLAIPAMAPLTSHVFLITRQ